MGVRFWARIEEPRKLDGFLHNVFEVADGILSLPASAGRLHTSGGTDSLYVCDIAHARWRSLFPLGETGSNSRHIESTQRVSLLEAHAASNQHSRGVRPSKYD